MPNKRSDKDNKAPLKILKGYSKERQNDVEQSYKHSTFLLIHLREVVGSWLDKSVKDTDKLEPGDLPDFQNKISHDIGYRKALRDVLGIFPEESEVGNNE